MLTVPEALKISDEMGLGDVPAAVLAAEVRRLQRLMEPVTISSVQHEESAQSFLFTVRMIMVDALKLSPEIQPDVFARVASIQRDLRDLLSEHAYIVERKLATKFRQDLAEFAKKL